MRNPVPESFSSSDFATLLDEVIAAAGQKDEEAAALARPSIPFDLLNPALGAPVSRVRRIICRPTPRPSPTLTR